MKIKYMMLICCISLTGGCSKDSVLGKKPEAALQIPSKLSDLQALLDHDGSINGLDAQGTTPQLGESGSDNFYLLDQNFNTNLRPQMQNYYIWKKQPYEGVSVLDWIYPYRNILMCNVVLDEIDNIPMKGEDKIAADRIKGEALFHRAHMFFQLAAVFAPIYYKGDNGSERSIPLRLTSDINEVLVFSTVKESFEKIETDLLLSAKLLPGISSLNTRPSKCAVFALLSRMYMYSGKYDKALIYADSSLQLNDKLIDYNTLAPQAAYPFNLGTASNPEIIFNSVMLSNITQSYPTRQTYARIDTLLYKQYHEGDLRKQLFFLSSPPGHRFKGSYHGSARYFAGLATDEVMLNKAECLARNDLLEPAVEVLDRLLRSRWDNKFTYVSPLAESSGELLTIILQERRKELIFRGIRWMDLKRFNREGMDISLKRVVNNTVYVLEPEEENWVWPFPNEVISFMISGMRD